MISHAYGPHDLATLMKNLGLKPAFDARHHQLMDFVNVFKTDLPGFAAEVSNHEDLPLIEEVANRIRTGFDHVVLFGTGGSSLGAQAAFAAGRYRSLKGPVSHTPVIHTPDSLDPNEMELLFKTLPPRRTHILVISKSGTTAETLAQLLVTRAWLEDHIAASDLSSHFTFITEPGARPLRHYGEKLGSVILDHPTTIGGRFSVLSVVGMLPVAIAGLDPIAFRTGAYAMLKMLLTSPAEAMPLEGAALIHTLADALSMSETLLMPYADCLRPFTRWHGQLWAESLGKDGKGITPIRAIGPVDQHSQLQLFMDGPNKRSITLISVPNYGNGPKIAAESARSVGLDYMANRTIGDTVSCQARATGSALRARARIVRDITIDAIDEKTLGGLFMSFMLETVLTAHLLHVDAYDQPAVEDGKILTRDYLKDL